MLLYMYLVLVGLILHQTGVVGQEDELLKKHTSDNCVADCVSMAALVARAATASVAAAVAASVCRTRHSRSHKCRPPLCP